MSTNREHLGLLFIGDPHLATRAPGWRKDDYPQAILGKLGWCLRYARENKLLPVILGDLFHHPREISNQMLVDLLTLLNEPVWTIAGNHDCHENSLTDSDTLSVLEAAGRIKLLERDGPWCGTIGGRSVIVGGTCWGDAIPEAFDRSQFGDARALVFWITHHDIRFPGNDAAADFDCREIPGIDVIINGHVHKQAIDARAGATTWMNPGNIARVQRSDVSRSQTPAVLRIDIASVAGVADAGPGSATPATDTHQSWRATRIDVPHQPFDEVFHAEMDSPEASQGESSFIKELAALESIRTASGQGLMAFLDANLGQFDPRVAAEIRSLAQEVLTNANR